MFAEKYIKRNNLCQPLFSEDVSVDTGIIVVIPCLKEPEIIKTIDSLEQCNIPKCQVEVIVLINHSEKAPVSTKKFNANTFDELNTKFKNIANNGIQYLVSKPVELKAKWAGAGLARKTGMDEATFRFNRINKPNGIIVSLDADTIVEQNYLVEIEDHFKKYPKDVGVTISFKHQLEGLSEKNKEGILLYEQYLKYYKEALSFTGFPHAIFTIGSAFAVTADAYVKRGGMTRRKAGEDFYFLQNLVQQGKVGEINSTTVYPSARSSDRVVFGTGASMKKWIDEKEDLTITYNFQAFIDLKELFSKKEILYQISEHDYLNFIQQLSKPLILFLEEDHIFNQLDDLNRNCSSLKVFNQRFYYLFNAFKILKFLNFCHQGFYIKKNLKHQVERLEKIK